MSHPKVGRLLIKHYIWFRRFNYFDDLLPNDADIHCPYHTAVTHSVGYMYDQLNRIFLDSFHIIVDFFHVFHQLIQTSFCCGHILHFWILCCGAPKMRCDALSWFHQIKSKRNLNRWWPHLLDKIASNKSNWVFFFARISFVSWSASNLISKIGWSLKIKY